MDDWATLSKTKERTHSGRDLSPQEWRGPAQAHKPAPALAQGYEWFRPMAGPGQGYRAGADGGTRRRASGVAGKKLADRLSTEA